MIENHLMCLNPFFIRSSFQREDIERIRYDHNGLNPFFIRSSFQSMITMEICTNR